MENLAVRSVVDREHRATWRLRKHKQIGGSGKEKPRRVKNTEPEH